MGRLAGKIALVTGASRGIGRAIALALAKEGAAIAVNYRSSEAEAQHVAEELHSLGVRTMLAQANVGDGTEMRAMVQRVVSTWGRIDVMVNNAGLGGTVNLVDMADEQWNVVLDVTLNGTFRCTRAALRHMGPRGTGVIVNNASVLGWRAQRGQAHYAAAKAGVMALTRCAAMEGAEFGVRVNAVAPSLAMHQFLAKVTSDELLEELTKVEAFGRAAEPWEIATVIAFLASDYSTYMTGEVVAVSSQHP